MSKGNRTLAFLGFGGKSKAENDQESEETARKNKARQNQDGDDADEDDDDEDEGDDDAKATARSNNRLRAAGERRGIAAERVRIGAILNGTDPAKAELALHFALNTDMTPAEAKASLDKAPAGASRTPFADAMARQPGRDLPPGGDRAPGAKGPTLADRMSADLKKRGLLKN
jgi:hypothetical protein